MKTIYCIAIDPVCQHSSAGGVDWFTTDLARDAAWHLMCTDPAHDNDKLTTFDLDVEDDLSGLGLTLAEDGAAWENAYKALRSHCKSNG